MFKTPHTLQKRRERIVRSTIKKAKTLSVVNGPNTVVALNAPTPKGFEYYSSIPSLFTSYFSHDQDWDSARGIVNSDGWSALVPGETDELLVWYAPACSTLSNNPLTPALLESFAADEDQRGQPKIPNMVGRLAFRLPLASIVPSVDVDSASSRIHLEVDQRNPSSLRAVVFAHSNGLVECWNMTKLPNPSSPFSFPFSSVYSSHTLSIGDKNAKPLITVLSTYAPDLLLIGTSTGMLFSLLLMLESPKPMLASAALVIAETAAKGWLWWAGAAQTSPMVAYSPIRSIVTGFLPSSSTTPAHVVLVAGDGLVTVSLPSATALVTATANGSEVTVTRTAVALSSLLPALATRLELAIDHQSREPAHSNVSLTSASIIAADYTRSHLTLLVHLPAAPVASAFALLYLSPRDFTATAVGDVPLPTLGPISPAHFFPLALPQSVLADPLLAAPYTAASTYTQGPLAAASPVAATAALSLLSVDVAPQTMMLRGGARADVTMVMVATRSHVLAVQMPDDVQVNKVITQLQGASNSNVTAGTAPANESLAVLAAITRPVVHAFPATGILATGIVFPPSAVVSAPAAFSASPSKLRPAPTIPADTPLFTALTLAGALARPVASQDPEFLIARPHADDALAEATRPAPVDRQPLSVLSHAFTVFTAQHALTNYTATPVLQAIAGSQRFASAVETLAARPVAGVVVDPTQGDCLARWATLLHALPHDLHLKPSAPTGDVDAVTSLGTTVTGLSASVPITAPLLDLTPLGGSTSLDDVVATLSISLIATVSEAKPQVRLQRHLDLLRFITAPSLLTSQFAPHTPVPAKQLCSLWNLLSPAARATLLAHHQVLLLASLLKLAAAQRYSHTHAVQDAMLPLEARALAQAAVDVLHALPPTEQASFAALQRQGHTPLDTVLACPALVPALLEMLVRNATDDATTESVADSLAHVSLQHSAATLPVCAAAVNAAIWALALFHAHVHSYTASLVHVLALPALVDYNGAIPAATHAVAGSSCSPLLIQSTHALQAVGLCSWPLSSAHTQLLTRLSATALHTYKLLLVGSGAAAPSLAHATPFAAISGATDKGVATCFRSMRTVALCLRELSTALFPALLARSVAAHTVSTSSPLSAWSQRSRAAAQEVECVLHQHLFVLYSVTARTKRCLVALSTEGTMASPLHAVAASLAAHVTAVVDALPLAALFELAAAARNHWLVLAMMHHAHLARAAAIALAGVDKTENESLLEMLPPLRAAVAAFGPAFVAVLFAAYTNTKSSAAPLPDLLAHSADVVAHYGLVPIPNLAQSPLPWATVSQPSTPAATLTTSPASSFLRSLRRTLPTLFSLSIDISCPLFACPGAQPTCDEDLCCGSCLHTRSTTTVSAVAAAYNRWLDSFLRSGDLAAALTSTSLKTNLDSPFLSLTAPLALATRSPYAVNTCRFLARQAMTGKSSAATGKAARADIPMPVDALVAIADMTAEVTGQDTNAIENDVRLLVIAESLRGEGALTAPHATAATIADAALTLARTLARQAPRDNACLAALWLALGTITSLVVADSASSLPGAPISDSELQQRVAALVDALLVSDSELLALIAQTKAADVTDTWRSDPTLPTTNAWTLLAALSAVERGIEHAELVATWPWTAAVPTGTVTASASVILVDALVRASDRMEGHVGHVVRLIARDARSL